MAKKFQTNQNLVNAGFQQLSGQTLSLSGNTLIGNCATFKYATNQHSRYVARSVVDASYVTGLTCTKVDKNIASQGEIIYRNATQLTGCCNMFYCDALPSISFGRNNIAGGIDSAILGGTSNIICCNNVCSAIIGGTGNVIFSGNSRSVILGGNATILTGTTYIDTVAVPNLAIFCTPVGVGNVLAWDCVTKLVCLTSASGSGTITGATNGLHAVGANVLLGGELTECTSIFGDCLDIKGVDGLNIRTTGNTDMNIDAQQCGAFAIKSQCGSCSVFTDFTDAVGIYGHVHVPNGFAIYDCRIGACQTGIVYAGDYSVNYVARSLVDKQYVDTVATGLNVHLAVFAATTSGITLSGSPQTIDGVTVTNGQRVLVKDQGIGTTGSPFNGIYIVTGVTWYRAPDYDNSPSGEVTNGDLIPVTSGDTQSNSLWALATPNPITIDVTPLIFTEFSRIVGVTGGNGICVTQSGGNSVVNVQLGTGTAVGCGLAVNASGLCIDSNIAGLALSYSTGVINVNAATGGTISAIPVRINAGNCLVVNCSSINAITGATNGLTRCGNDVWLGGTLIANTFINLCGDNLIITGDTLGTPFGLDVRPTEINIGDYNSAQLDYIHHTQALTKIAHSFSGSCSSIVVDYLNTCMHQAVNNFTGDFCINCGYVCMNSQCSGGTMMCTTICPIEFNVRSINAGNHCLQVTTGSTFIFQGIGSNNAQICLNRCNVCMSQADTDLSCSAVCLSNGSVCLYSNICNTSIGDINLSGNSMYIAGSAGFQGIKYVVDNSANFIARSLVDAAYVTGKTSTSGVQTANNGLCKEGTNVCLGGVLVGNTVINLAGFSLKFNNGCIVSSGTTGQGFDSYNDYKLSGSTILSIPRRNFIYGNIAIGYQALCCTGISCRNIAIGYQALSANTISCGNIALGYKALVSNTCGNNNIGIDSCALFNNICGCNNIAQGNKALVSNICGCNNIALGYQALSANTNVSGNIALGCKALSHDTSGLANIAIGDFALICNDIGCYDIAIGAQALFCNTCGCQNIAIGADTLHFNTSGLYNTAIGAQALQTNLTGNFNTAIGAQALLNNSSGCENIAIGVQTLCGNSSGCNNIAIGNTAGCAETGSNKLYIDVSGTVNPLIYGEFDTKCVVINGYLKISGVTNGTCSNCMLVWDTSTHEVKKVPFSSGSTNTDKNNIYSKTIITGNTLLTTGSSYVILVSGTSITITLPTTPSSGQAFKIKDACGNALTSNIIIDSGAGRTIDGSQCAIINTNYGAMEVMFGATCKWFNLSFIN